MVADGRAASAASFDEVGAESSPRRWSVSIAVPGSILDNAQSSELRATLACQVARAAAIFCVDEIVVFREGARSAADDGADDLALYLSYLDTPQYLRRHLFPRSQKLRHAGLLHPLNLPNHFAKADTPRWRDGVAAAPSGAGRGAPQRTRFVDVGLQRLAEVDHEVEPNARVTVDLAASGTGYSVPGRHVYGQVVPRNTPREEEGLYWGYEVRVADSLLEAMRGSASGHEYDLVVGTSDKGVSIGSPHGAHSGPAFALPEFTHALIVFGGVAGLEHSARCDERLAAAGFGSEVEGGNAPALGDLFDFYLNTCPSQGSRTIRTEEAIPISLASIRPFLRPINS